MKILLNILKWTGFILLFFMIGFASFVQAGWNKTFEADLPDIHASTDSSVIKHGEYLVYGPAHCADCHVATRDLARLERGEKIPLTGGHIFDFPIGQIVSSNLTPDPESGIGKITDAEIARTLRHNIGHDGRGLLGLMAFQHMSEADVVAVISYLRSREAIKSDHKPSSWNFLGRAIWAMGMIQPEGPSEEIPKYVSPDTTADYGKYLANSISNCKGCHTNRDMKTGAFTSPVFSGGFVMPSELHPGRSYVTPNITPDPTTGWMRNWTEQMFIDRLHKGRVYDDSPMPWTSFKNFSDNDLKALYRYLSTLHPIARDNGPAVIEKL